jgi:EmrB/QacA subfamily drug resistance transporter
VSKNNLKKTVLAVTTFTSFLTPFMISAVNITLPRVQADFQTNAFMLSWIANSYFLATAAFLLPIGKLADIHGRKKTYVTGIAVFSLGSLFAAFSPNIETLIALRAVQGLGGAMITTTGMAIITSVFPPTERGRAMGIVVAGVYLGISLGPYTGGLITDLLGWRAVYAIFGILCMWAFYRALTRLDQEWADAKGEKLDWAGSFLYTPFLVALIFGISNISESYGPWCILVGVSGLLAFVWWELKVKNPVFEVRLFYENRVFAFSSLAALINYAATVGVAFFLGQYLQFVRGMSPHEAGLVLLVQPAMQALFSPLAGKLSDRIEPRIIATAGMAMNTLGLGFMIMVGLDTRTSLIIANLAFLGLGFAFFSSPNTNAIMSSVEPRHLGVASGAVATMRTVGMVFSLTAASLVFSLYLGENPIGPDNLHLFLKSQSVSFVFFTLLAAFGTICSMIRGRLRD